MSAVGRRAWRWFAVLVGLGLIDLGLTIHAHLDFHRTPGGPSVMPIGQLLGWATSALLLITACLVALGASYDRRYRGGGH